LASSSRRNFITAAAALGSASQIAAQNTEPTERDRWIQLLTRVCDPVLAALSERKLKASMPVEAPHGNAHDRRQYTYLEALGRLLTGLSSWLEAAETSAHEAGLREHYGKLARQAIAASVDPASPDFMNFHTGSQPVVDAAFLALALLRAPVELWQKLESSTKAQLFAALRSSRVIRPGFNNWLLFSATIEAFLCPAGEDWDAMRVDYAVRQHEEWYKGDGLYGDGPQFHWDYYNSFVIQPMLLAVLDAVAKTSSAWTGLFPAIQTRARRYAAIQERLISPEGTFPAIGRSLAYRCGAFHHLASMALRRELPEALPPEQVRAALSAVIGKSIEAPGTFDSQGWLTVGFCGHQPMIAEPYISTGSLYLCTAAFLPLGLAPSDPFWSRPPKPWTARRIWTGENIGADHAV
jgi:hypothetical protein